MDIPYDRLDIPAALRPRLDPESPRATRLEAARGLPTELPEVELSALYVLACDADDEVRETALASLRQLPKPAERIDQSTHPKVLELLASLRHEPELDARIMEIRNTNDRTAILIASRASAELASAIVDNHERLLITPDVVVALHQNPRCDDETIERAISLLRMHRMLPQLPEKRGDPPPAAPASFDLEAEIEAALRGEASPHLANRQNLELFDLDKLGAEPLKGFNFDFADDAEFSLDMLEDRDEGMVAEERSNLERRIAKLSPGKKIKLAYLGNKEVRSILIRDRSKMVACAVVKSGRLTDAEVLAYSANRNLESDVLREIANNREWTRRYPVQVALVNNPRCPPSIAVRFVTLLQAKDLAALARNRNVSSVVFQMASRLAAQKSGQK